MMICLSRLINGLTNEWQPGGIRPQIVKAIHGDLAGAIGAAFCDEQEKDGWDLLDWRNKKTLRICLVSPSVF